MSGSKLQQWELKATTGSHFDSLDGLRGVAILLVVIQHSMYTNPADGTLAQVMGYIFTAGWMGVPIFFVLSGFLISYPFFQKRDENPQFWYQRGYVWRRVGKILPPFYLSIILFLGFYYVLYPGHPFYWRSALLWGTGMGNFVVVEPVFNGSYWSLIVESHFYIALPLLFLCTRGLGVRATAAVLFGTLFFVAVLGRHYAWPEGMTVSPATDDPVGKYMFMALKRFPCMLDYFAWGIAFAGVYVGLGAVRKHVGVLSLFGYSGAALLVVSLAFYGYCIRQFDIRGHPTIWSVELEHFLPALAAMLMLFFVFDPNCLGSRILSMGWLKFTGIISYELFLFNLPVATWFHEHFGPSHGNVLAYAMRTVFPVVIAYVFSVLVYRYFSLPILNHIRNRLKMPSSIDK